MSTKAPALRDRQTFPFLMIPKAFFTRFNPSLKALAAYTAIKYYACNAQQSCERISIPAMARRVGLSESSFKRGIDELVRKKAVIVRQRSRKGPEGRIPMPNLYEIVNIDTTAAEEPI